MRTEDHPPDYGDFEGVIPQGEYGGGTVMLWDRGLWAPDGDPEAGLRKGRLDFELEGEKLRGRWTMVRSGKDARGKESWLLFKRTDGHARPGTAGALLEERPLSVSTGRSMDEIAEDRSRVWSSTEEGGGARARGAPAAIDLSGEERKRQGLERPFRPDPQGL